jgi:hypothetical protein
MNDAPRITSIGPPPERHAERIVDEMILWLHGRQQEIWVKAKGSLRTKQLGNPVGQTRAVARMREALGDMVLALDLQTGKRGRFVLQMIAWTVWDSARNASVELDAPPPAYASLGVVYATTDRTREWRGTIPLVVTRHALVRLAERAGMRTVEDLYDALLLIWRGFCDILSSGDDNALARNRTFNPPPQGWRVPLRHGFGVAVMSKNDAAADEPRLVVKTILPVGCEALLPDDKAA